MKDNLGRKVTHMSISVTEQCNLRCRYCRPEEGLPCAGAMGVLEFDELLRLAGIGTALGIQKITITGGEPLIRENIVTFIKKLKNLDDVESVALLSNGLLLYPLLPELKEAGLDKVIIHLDTTQSHQYKRLTREKYSSADVLKSVWRTVSLDLSTSILCVLQKETKNEIPILAGLAKYYPIDAEFMELLPIRWWHESEPLTASEAMEKLRASYPDLSLETEGTNGEILRYYQSSKLKGRIGIMDAVSNSECGLEQNIHLSCQGILSKGVKTEWTCDLGKMLQEKRTDVEIKAAMRNFIVGSGRTV